MKTSYDLFGKGRKPWRGKKTGLYLVTLLLLFYLSSPPSWGGNLGGFQVDVGEGIGQVPSSWDDGIPAPTQAAPSQSGEDSGGIFVNPDSQAQTDTLTQVIPVIPAQPTYEETLSDSQANPPWDVQYVDNNTLPSEGVNNEGSVDQGSVNQGSVNQGSVNQGSGYQGNVDQGSQNALLQTGGGYSSQTTSDSLAPGDSPSLFYGGEDLSQQGGSQSETAPGEKEKAREVAPLEGREEKQKLKAAGGTEEIYPSVVFTRITDYPGGVYIESECSLTVLSYRLNKKEVPYKWKGALLLPADQEKKKRTRIDLALLVEGEHILCVHYDS